jgi:hypothetical protein
MELIRQEHVLSNNDKDYTIRIPSVTSFGLETGGIIFVPKRTGIIQIIIEVKSEFGGDNEIVTVFVPESGIKRKQSTIRFFDLKSEKKIYGPIVVKITPTPTLRKVKFIVSGKFYFVL